jgi:uncharacterized membrane protein
MDRRLINHLLTPLVVLAIFLVGYAFHVSSFQIDKATVVLRFAIVVLGILISFAVYLGTRQNKAWENGPRQVVWMAIGAALDVVFSWLFDGTVFFVPSISQVALMPAIAIPMFLGYTLGPVVGFFSGAVGKIFGDALTGFGLSPQRSIANGLIGFIAGLPLLFAGKERSLNVVLIVGAVLSALAVGIYFISRSETNRLSYASAEPTSLPAGISLLIGLVLVLILRFAFRKNIGFATAMTWSMLGNILSMGFAAGSDSWINGYIPAAATVGEFLPAAGPNLIFATILVPLLVVAYEAVQKQSERWPAYLLLAKGIQWRGFRSLNTDLTITA